MNNFVLIPMITEKSMIDAGSSKFTFRVPRFADKGSVKKHVEKNFEVNVVSISSTTIKGRSMRVGVRRNEVEKGAWKKMVVKLKDGQKIGLFELGEKK
jgi:large subunit ribosomal protein L23